MQNLLSANGIKLILFDLDDTLLETNLIFRQCLEPLKVALAIDIGADIEQFGSDFEDCMLLSKAKNHVDPNYLWIGLFEILKERYPKLTSKLISDAFIEIKVKIYGTPIPLKPGAMELLLQLQNTGIPIGIVTNADAEWSDFKMAMAGIYEIVPKEHVFVIPPQIAKVSRHWQEAMQYFAVAPEDTLVIGDNVKADILAAREVGVKNTILLHEPLNNWIAHADGIEKLAKLGIIVVERVKEITNLLLNPMEPTLLPVR